MLKIPVTSLSKGKTVEENSTSVLDLIFLIFFFFSQQEVLGSYVRCFT